ncbi:MAG: glycoside hydrolase family 127 protein [Phycisphaerae bacterium]|nr:glycoside hydrolase family 127 protein [Phycisphaerae bacterium]
MNSNPILCVSVLIIVAGWLAFASQSFGESGDQFLDGIGETALVARYVLNGNTEDRSRNNFHGVVKGGKPAYVKDRTFGSVLSLTGGAKGAYLQLPGQAAIGVDSISVAGWVYVRDDASGRMFFDFGQDAKRSFSCTAIGGGASRRFSAGITVTGKSGEIGPESKAIATKKWLHLAVVLDADKKTISCYVDGARVGRTSGVKLSLDKVFNPEKASANVLTFGKGHGNLNAKLHDLRIYRIALSDKQVGVIRTNALSGKKTVGSGADTAGDEKTNAADAARALPKGSLLVSIPHVSASTISGHLPRLPARIRGVYRDGIKGPMLRAIWPAPTDSSQARKIGTYTIIGKVPGTKFKPKATVTVKAAPKTAPGPKNTMTPFALGDVILDQDVKNRDTQFIKNRDKFVLTLADTDPDRFLYNFRDAFGQKQPEGAKPLGGWDSQKTRLRGHGSGHYLSAIAQACASATYDEKLRKKFMKKMEYSIDTLYKLSQLSGRPVKKGGPCNADPASVPKGPNREGYDSDLSKEGIRTDYWNWGEGFISGYPPDQFIMLEKGATYGGKNTQIWAPYYTLHKILAGLLDCYEVGGNEKALKIAEGMGTWVYQRLKVVPTKTRISMWNRYIAGEYGGMNEVMARLHTITGKKKYLQCAILFDNISFFFGDPEHSGGLAKNVDTIRKKHANQHIPQITGALETYKGAKDIQYYRVADNFWDICTNSYVYSIGGVAGAKNPKNAECFTAEPNSLLANGFAKGGQCETCATYNMLKLSRQLFMFDPDGKFMDYYERALYNHILASVGEKNAGNTYHVPLNPGARKHFGNPQMTGFSCCNGTAIESSTKLQDSIYFKSSDNSTLYVNLYVPSTLTWKARKVSLKQSTSYPYADTSKLTIAGGGEFSIKVRVPKWATRGFSVKINGKEQKTDARAGTYLALKRKWKDADTIELKMPFSFHLNQVMDQPNIASIFYGPVLLAVEEPEAMSIWRKMTLDADDIGKSITGDPATLRFKTNGVNLKPFFETYDRHSVYVDVTLKQAP